MEELHKKQEYRHIPVLALTGKELDENEKSELSEKVDTVVEKGPHSLDILLGRLRELVKEDLLDEAS